MSGVQSQPTASRKRGRPGTNREKLLTGAARCLREKGYAGTTARDLVEASGTNLASIGYHFGSKEALLNEAVGRSMTAWMATIEKEVFAQSAATPRKRLELALAAMLDRFDELEPYVLSFVEAFPAAVRSPELRESMAAAYGRARESAAGMFARAMDESDVAGEERTAYTLASLMLAVCDGFILQWLLDPESTPDSRDVMDALRAALPTFCSDAG